MDDATPSRKYRQVTRGEILAAAVVLCELHGIYSLKRDDVADKANCAQGSVNAHFGTIEGLRREVMRHAVTVGNLNIVAQGLAINDGIALTAPEKLRRAAAKALMGA